MTSRHCRLGYHRRCEGCGCTCHPPPVHAPPRGTRYRPIPAPQRAELPPSCIEVSPVAAKLRRRAERYGVAR